MRRLLAASAGLVLALSLATGVLAWGNLSLTANCMPQQETLAWTIQLPSENNFEVDWSFEADFSTFTTTDFGSAGAHDFTTPNGGPVLYVRWSSDHETTAQADRNEELCTSGASTPTAEGSVMGGTGTPAQSPEGSVMGGTGTPAPGIPDTSLTPGSSSPIVAFAFGMLLIGSLGVLAFANVRAR